MNLIKIITVFLCLFLTSFTFKDEFLWNELEKEKQKGLLERLISLRQEYIHGIHESFKPLVEEQEKENPSFFSELQRILKFQSLDLIQEGSSAAYVLKDEKKRPKFIIKPFDENIFCLHNPKKFASPFLNPRVKTNIPLYRAAQTDALCFELASICNLDHITPKAFLSFVSHRGFSFNALQPKQNIQPYDKLCSVQEYLENTEALKSVLEFFFAENVSEENLLLRFDHEDFSDIQLFLWIIYDNDAHTDNLRVYPKFINPDGSQVYGIKKIDNSLAFPEKNSMFSNALMYFPHALEPISERIKTKIKYLPIEKMKESIEKFGFASSMDAFEVRIATLKELLKRPDLNYYECSLRMALLSRPGGQKFSLEDLPLDVLEQANKGLIELSNYY